MRGEPAARAALHPLNRLSLCFSTAQRGEVLQGGDARFAAELQKFYPAAESNAAEQLVLLKSRLIAATAEEFWRTATEGIATICGAQYGFISKRVLVNDHDVPVEMPPLGEKGSCLMGMAFYCKDDSKGDGADGPASTTPNMRYEAYSAPCAYMKHDKVFIIPGNGETFTPAAENPNTPTLPRPISSYIAVPLFSDGKCFAHFGVSWSPEGEQKRSLGWAFLEMLLHALEDIVLQRVLEGSGFGEQVKNSAPDSQPRPQQVVPHDAISVSQSLKPYARSLSHELRTPMQGVVGMLDVMHATVQEAVEGLTDPRMRDIFETLRENIETVQDSSRRAVEAADNVVHAYDMNMGVPEVSEATSPIDEFEISPLEETASREPRTRDRRPEIVVTGNYMPITSFSQVRKRRRDSPHRAEAVAATSKRRRPSEDERAIHFAEAIKRISPHHHPAGQREADFEYFAAAPQPAAESLLESPPCISEQGIAPGLRHTSLRDVLQYVVNDALRVGGRPDSAVAQQTDDGEIIEVQVKNSAGDAHVKIIEWAVDQAVPETMLIDEKDFAKMISCVFLNAVKFTEQGKITIRARLSSTSRRRYIVISVTDTGPGIPKAFLPNLFKPFAREDDSLTRQSEGLGLGLLVAKGLARKLRGDLNCVRAETSGPEHGCEFEIRVPITPGDAISRPASPFGSPAPSNRSRPRSVDSQGFEAERSNPHRLSIGHTVSPQPTSMPVHRLSTQSPALQSAHLPPHRSALSQQINEPSSPVERGRKRDSPSSVDMTSPAHARAPQPPPPSQHLQRPSLAATRRRHSARPRATTTNGHGIEFDRELGRKHPLTFLVADDNKINRKLLVSMLKKLGYEGVHEAYDGADAVRVMEGLRAGTIGGVNGEPSKPVDVVLMDLWMPLMDGYEAAEKILSMPPPTPSADANQTNGLAAGTAAEWKHPTILAVTADVTDGALERAARVGMKGYMTKPYKLVDLERLIVEYCASSGSGSYEYYD